MNCKSRCRQFDHTGQRRILMRRTVPISRHYIHGEPRVKEEVVIVERAGRVGVITLNRPKVLNALNDEQVAPWWAYLWWPRIAEFSPRRAGARPPPGTNRPRRR